ncbi:hypothetical protein ACTWP5_26440 [Streptomyces sp. 4N509B]|uniref:hypothetical protein n=1 Tax=Streptomyces sp. 4N509B TaxID=3457413 RepID=UPI003FD05A74
MEGRTAEYAVVVAELAAFRRDRLRGRPSDRALAHAAGVSPTTIGNWLVRGQFPQEVDPLLALVRAVRAQAERAGLTRDPAVAALLEAERWRGVYRAEARRRGDATGVAVRAEQGRAVLERMRPGRPLGEVTDPFHLEVHRAISAPDGAGPPTLPVLPAYVPREHDRRLAEAVARAADGTSRIAVLVGGSSTGKTRACWEALAPLRTRPEPWRLWHPIDPTRPDAALAELADVAPHTVVWLNEAQFYLAPEPLGERVAAGLRALLRDARRAPVLVLATLWPKYWRTLTTPSGTATDPHADARQLLEGHSITVPDAFTGADLVALGDAAGDDPRLGEAAEQARDGRVTQYLAGVPVLMERYDHAPPATRALINAAMDARRLGAGPHIPLAWLAEAAPGYLTDDAWDRTEEDWLPRALAYVTQPCKGIPGILTAVRNGEPRNRRRGRRTAAGTPRVEAAPPDSGPSAPSEPSAPSGPSGPHYRLADYLDQHGRRHRAGQIPPVDFWTAAATHAHPTDLEALGDAAWDRGLYRDAAQLHKNATPHSASAATSLLHHLHELHPTDQRPAEWAATRVPLGDALAVVRLLARLLMAGVTGHAGAVVARAVSQVSLDLPLAVGNSLRFLREAGAWEHVTALAGRVASQVSLDSPSEVGGLLESLRKVGAAEQVDVLLARDPASRVSLDSPYGVGRLLHSLCEVEAAEQVDVLLARDPATHVRLDDVFAVGGLLEGLRRVGAGQQAAALAARAVREVPLDDPWVVGRLLSSVWGVELRDQVDALVARDPASLVSLDNAFSVGGLLEVLRRVGAVGQLAALATRAAGAVSLDDPSAVGELLEGLRRVGAVGEAAALATRAAGAVSLDDPSAVGELLEGLRRVGAVGEAAALAARAASGVALDDPYAVGELLADLREGEAREQADVLLARDPARRVPLDEPFGLGRLLDRLVQVGAREQLDVLLTRDPASQVSLDDLAAASVLLDSLRAAGAVEQAAALAARMACHAPLDNPHPVGGLLSVLREAGPPELADVLVARLPAAGRFFEFLGIDGHRERFRFGREPDGSAAAAWTWEDLE